jgi:hypothetical protein
MYSSLEVNLTLGLIDMLIRNLLSDTILEPANTLRSRARSKVCGLWVIEPETYYSSR